MNKKVSMNNSIEESFPPLQHPSKNSQHNQSVSYQNLNLSVNGSCRDDQVHDLMSSIQNKLSMLVCEDSYEGEDF